LRNTEKKMPKKGLFETFNASHADSLGNKSRIIRRLRSFVLRDTVDFD